MSLKMAKQYSVIALLPMPIPKDNGAHITQKKNISKQRKLFAEKKTRDKPSIQLKYALILPTSDNCEWQKLAGMPTATSLLASSSQSFMEKK
jgi:hypothetical protein